MVGQTLQHRYRLDALLGAGGMATVYRGWDHRLERAVAVKVLAPNLAADPATAARFRAEARHLAAMSHPGIVSVFDVGEADGEPFFVMELVEGESLEDRLRRETRLTPDAAIPIVISVASGLTALHRRSFIHRDVKPHNVLLDSGGRARLADFGLVRGEASTELTAPGSALGTLAYMAPELLRGEPASPASDVYALGVVTYRALTGSLPFPAETLAGIFAAQAGAHDPPSRRWPALGGGFDAPLARALGPAGGRPSARELAAELLAARDGIPAPAVAPVPGRHDGPTEVVSGQPPSQHALAEVAGDSGSRRPALRALASRQPPDHGDRRGRRLAPLLALFGLVVGAAVLIAALAGSGAAPGRSPGTSVRGGGGGSPTTAVERTRRPRGSQRARATEPAATRTQTATTREPSPQPTASPVVTPLVTPPPTAPPPTPVPDTPPPATAVPATPEPPPDAEALALAALASFEVTLGEAADAGLDPSDEAQLRQAAEGVRNAVTGGSPAEAREAAADLVEETDDAADDALDDGVPADLVTQLQSRAAAVRDAALNL